MNQPKKTIIVPAGTARPNVGLLLNFNQERRGGLAVELLLVMEKKEGRSYQRIPLSGNHKPYLQGLPVPLAQVIQRLSDEALVEHLVRNGFAWLRDADKPFDLLDERHYMLLRTWVSEVLQELKPLVPVVKYLFYLPIGESFHSTAIRPAALSAASPAMQWVLERRNGMLHLCCSVAINNGVFPVEDFAVAPYFLKSGNEFFLLEPADRVLLERYRSGEFVVREEGLPRFMATVVKPLAEQYPVNTDAVILTESVDVQPQPQVYVTELNENFLLIKPKWSYAGHEVEESEEDETRVEYEDRLVLIARKKEEERSLMDALKGLHSKFEGQSNGYFYLNFKEALEKNWFLRFYSLMQEMDVPVLGMNKLRKFKYNTNVPSFEIVAGRSIDWFDLTIRVTYGDLVVPLHELRKAILGRQEFILLSDGSLGVLPKEWLDKYALLLKMGQFREGGMRLPALHWGILSELGGALAEAGGVEALQAELEEKKQRWANFAGGALGDGGADGASGGGAGDEGASGGGAGSGGASGALAGARWIVPAAVQAKLRDYQVAGFRWMCLLNEMGWGGCLADDMGLGKTLQALSFLQHVVELHPAETHLVVCPTSLLYNWEMELKKFLPGLDYQLHYGAGRVLDESVFRRAHVIITSYGMVRNDIQHFASFTFGYVILDESQAIKNPASQIRKAVMQLRSRNRLALSGTPVQNNTFDLYAQMDFLNPGMLGGADFFRAEFASPIDRNGDPVAAARLRKLIYPFILRRTKEQVARDLPDRTEMILWCEMGEEQRRIYDSYRQHYRESLLGRIAEEGMGKSSIYILEGLTKLRQICDSPALLKDFRGGPASGTGGVVAAGGADGPGTAGGADGPGTGTAGEPDRLAAGAGEPGAAGDPAMSGEPGAAGEPDEPVANDTGAAGAGGADNPVPTASVKLEELVREIEENTGAHKVLVFSQFTSMLALIRQALGAKRIPYLYLDGSVSAEDRKAGVQRFQEDDTMRVFLISLKAGGVGLTLTAADYVYLVDPWWNPAAEQQAIDRSHRIGQINKVFAYRMICKDTVEEKILQLQEKKRSLAADLVADEAGFVKHLSQDDVAFLFG